MRKIRNSTVQEVKSSISYIHLFIPSLHFLKHASQKNVIFVTFTMTFSRKFYFETFSRVSFQGKFGRGVNHSFVF